MAGILNAILLAGGTVLGFAPVLDKFIHNTIEPEYIVRVGLGSALVESSSLGGNAPSISLWTVRGEAIGGKFGSSHNIIGDSGFYEVSIPGNSSLGNGKAPAQYISIVNGGDDAICISYITVTEPSGNKWAVFGDVAKQCGFDWYESLLSVGDETPACMWIDGNGSNGLRYQGVGIHLPSFSTFTRKQGLLEEYKSNVDTMCKSGPRLRMYERINAEDPILFFSPPFTPSDFNADGSDKDISKIIGNPGKFTDINMDMANAACVTDKGCPGIIDQLHQAGHFPDIPVPAPFVKRQLKQAWDPELLVVSHLASHSAERMCSNPGSRGPDFVSMAEMKYCNLDTRTVWDVCSNSTISCCFDVNTKQMNPCGHWVKTTPKRNVPNTSYSSVKHWGQ